MTMLTNALSWVRSLQVRHLTHQQEVPEKYREDGILTGYRLANQPWRYYIGSLFQIHNETLNVWTHLIGMFIIWYALGQYFLIYDWWTDKDSWPMLTFGICSSLTHLLSSLAHLLHSKNLYVHHLVFMIDFIGVVLFAFGTGILAMYSCSDKEMYMVLKPFYLYVLAFMTWFNHAFFCFALLCFSGGPQVVKRRALQVGALLVEVVLIFIPFFPRYCKCFADPECSLRSFDHITLTFPAFGAQAFFFLSQIPERFFPGKFDIVGHSHQIFHVCATVAQLLQMRAVHQDIQNGVSSHAQPDLSSMLTVLTVLIVCSIGSICFLQQYIPCSLKRVKAK
ncbi:membrane progestin receptor beta-like [Argopecten irradians]|uniref:membrane progestin receptor beta-like n=1 Tax=Argopecten irradians TaxID=31199 RepID=UPI003720E0F0